MYLTVGIQPKIYGQKWDSLWRHYWKPGGVSKQGDSRNTSNEIMTIFFRSLQRFGDFFF